MPHLVIEYADPCNLADTLSVKFRLLDNPVVPLWINELQQALGGRIDHPDRFYGFNDPATEERSALARINECINEINAHSPLIDRHLTDINDQDTLNYLHHIFEVYHGLLGKPHKFYLRAPENVRRALSDLNILVHRCEMVTRARKPRHIVTWFGLARKHTLLDEHYQWFTDEHEFGTIFLNYVDIGKTIYDMAMDNDQYMASEAFQPFRHYSADIVVKYWATDPLFIKQRRAKIHEYYEKNVDFFGPWQPCYANGSVPVAIIDQSLDLNDIVSRQYVKSVTLD